MADKKTAKTNKAPSSKEEALELALSILDKKFGKGSVMKMGEKPTMNVNAISTGCLELDIALGVNGLPKGRIIEIYGAESSGKTTLALHCVAEAQKAGGTAAYIDLENALDPVYAANIGVDIANLYISQPDTGEDALEIVDTLVSSGAIDMIVIDSVAALVPRAEIEGGIGDTHVGTQARLMSQALRKLAGTINKTKCIAIFINQLREKIGAYGNPETTPGGRALKFYASVRIDVRKGEPIKQGDQVIGNVTKAKVTKNKVAPPFKLAVFDLMYGKGISKDGSILNIATEAGIIEKSGAWYSYKGNRIGQGKENAKQYLKDNPEIAQEIEQKIRQSTITMETEADDAENGELPTPPADFE